MQIAKACTAIGIRKDWPTAYSTAVGLGSAIAAAVTHGRTFDRIGLTIKNVRPQRLVGIVIAKNDECGLENDPKV